MKRVLLNSLILAVRGVSDGAAVAQYKWRRRTHPRLPRLPTAGRRPS